MLPVQAASIPEKRPHSEMSYKRLEDGKFRWPRIEAGVMRLSPAQLTTLFEGLDWTRVHVRRVRTPQEVL